MASKIQVKFTRNHLPTIPDVCIQVILRHLSLHDHFHSLRLVSRQWLALQRSVLYKRESLTLLLGPTALGILVTSEFSISISQYLNNLEQDEFDQLAFDQLNLEIIVNLIYELPQITKLTISLDCSSLSQIDHLIGLLRSHWSTELTSLKLYFYIVDEEEGEYESQKWKFTEKLICLMDQINSLPKLVHLTLDVRNWFWADLLARKPELSLPNSLEDFYIDSLDDVVVILNWTRKLMNSPQNFLKKIGFGHEIYSNSYLDKFVQLPVEQAMKFTNINMHYQSEESLAKCCAHFRSLQTLILSFCDLSFGKLAKCLATLDGLENLELKNSRFNEIDNSNVEEKKIFQFKSLKMLTFDIYTTTHDQLANENWERILPNLEVLKLFNDYHECRQCGYKTPEEVTTRQQNDCVKQLLQPWVSIFQNGKMNKIFTFKPELREWTLGDL